MHKLLYTCFLIGFTASCNAALNVEFNTTQPTYTVGDNVTFTCYVKPGWRGVVLSRNHTAIYDCYSSLGVCLLPDNQTSPYTAKLINSNPTLFINNVTHEDSGVNFTCLWISDLANVSFTVQERTIPINAEEGNMVVPILKILGSLCGVVAFIVVLILVYSYRKHGNWMEIPRRVYNIGREQYNKEYHGDPSREQMMSTIRTEDDNKNTSAT